jgi:hypothetical protein
MLGKTMKVRIEYSLYQTAFNNWKAYDRTNSALDYGHGLLKLLGLNKKGDMTWAWDSNNSFSSDWVFVSEETARKILLLASPHYYAILKAHEAQGTPL